MVRNMVKGLLIALLILGLPAMSSAQDDNANTMVGSWDLTANGDDSTRVSATFHRDGTYTNTPSSGIITSVHGVWKKVGPRTYVERSKGFVTDASGALVVTVDNREVIELSDDGDSYTGEVVAEIRLPNGTLVSTVGSSVVGTRIVIDF